MRLLIIGCWVVVSCGLMTSAAAQSKRAEAEQLKFFEEKIRPVLVEHCYACHSAESSDLGGSLQVDSRPGLLAGGDNGPAIVPGKPDQSLLLAAIKHSDRNLIMPPKESGPKLSDSVIADFEKWIRTGAFDPRTEAVKAAKKKYDPQAARSWWAWQTRKPVTPPAVSDEGWIRDPIDRFVMAAWEREGLQPNADADRVTLVRRLAFDLTGLPPTVPELYDFALQPEPKPLSELVDRYLASDAYGERFGRRWLDVARYAESAGKDLNGMFPHAWRYRDYVIDAFKADMSFRSFIVEQLAGDLLPSKQSADKGRRLIATGFLAIGPKGLNDMNARQFAVDVADEQIDTLSQAFLGITIACARCHDHKFDPISQKDYTAMAGIFLSTETHYGTQGGVGGRNRSTLLELPNSFQAPEAYSQRDAEELDRMRQRLEELRTEQRALVAERVKERSQGGGAGNPGPELLRLQQQLVSLETDLAQYADDGSLKPLAMGVEDKPLTPEANSMAGRLRGRAGPGGRPQRMPQRPGILPPEMMVINDSPLFERGEIEKPGERVPRGLPVFFAKGSKAVVPPATSGRLELARWIAQENNPLTTRVIVNRVWGWTIGSGIVGSVDNFGSTGDLPSHPELLDYLAQEFVSHNWSIKYLVRRIVLSHTYALSSAHSETSFAVDPDNKFLWRAHVKTLEAEAVRDAVLAASGQLDLARPVGSLISLAGNGVIGGRPNAPRAAGISEEQITKAESKYRSIYLPTPRNLLPDSMDLFDFPDNSMVHGTRETTLVPGQSLYWMNSRSIEQAASAIAQRASRGDDTQARFQDVCLLTLSRLPLAAESQAVSEFVAQQKSSGATDAQIWTSVCKAILSSADFRRLR